MNFTDFNPQLQNEEDFLANFVARGTVLDYFLRQLRLLEPTRAATHHLIVAPRGYGKTSLLRRVAIAVRTESGLKSRLIALSFREEQHNVISLDVFWRNCLQSLLEVREDENATEDEIQRLEAAWAKYSPRQSMKREDQDGEPAKQEFYEHCKGLARRPLLLIDNLDALLEGLPDNHHWSLRNELQAAGGPILIAAASRYPESTHDQRTAFYDFFRIETLDKLDDEEVMYCLRVRAEHRGEAGQIVLRLIEDNPGRIAALNTLAGGNPRTLGVLYRVLESNAGADVLSQLSAMLDTFTGWYQARTEELAMQSRAVFDALALNWDPMTAAALGEATGLDTAMVSSQLSRLEKSGYIETVSLSGRKKGRNGYQVSERFFNIWYLMRNGPRRARQSIRFLAVFLQSCFSPRERHSIARAVLQDSEADPGYALALASSIGGKRLRNQLIEHADILSTRLGTAEEYGAAIQDLRKSGELRNIVLETTSGVSVVETIKTLDRKIEQLSSAKGSASHIELAIAIVNRGVRLGQLGKSEEEIKVYDNVVDRFGDAKEAALREQVAMALVNKGFRLGQLGKSEDAIKVYDNVVDRFGEPKEAAFREQVAMALFNKGCTLGQLGKSEDEIKAYDNVVDRFGEAKEAALREQVAMALVNKGFRLGQLGKLEDAIKVYDNVVVRLGESKEAALRERVAMALFNKGVTLDQLGKSEDEIKVYDNVVDRFGEAKEAALRERVAKALVNKGVTLGQLGKSVDEIKVYDNVVDRFGEANEAALREQVARALFNKGVTLGQLGKSEDAIKVYENVVDRFGEAKETALRERVAKALFNKGARLGQLGKSEDEIKVYDNIVDRFGEAKEAALREQVAMALVNKGFTLGQLGKPEGEIKVYDNVVDRFGEAKEAALREQVARALVNKGLTLGQLGNSEGEIKVYDNVVDRFGDAKEAALREQVAMALVNKGFILGQIGKSEDAIKVYDNVVDRFGEANDAALREQVARALFNKGVTLGQRGKSEDAIKVYENVVDRFGEATETALRERVAKALFNKGVRLGQLGKSEDEIKVYDNIVDRFGEAKEAALRERVAKALVNKGFTLGLLGKSEDAIKVYENVVNRFGEAKEAALREQVARALFNKGFILGQLGKSEDAIKVYENVVDRFGEAKEAALRDLVANSFVRLGNSFLERLGDPKNALSAFENGLTRKPTLTAQQILHANTAYVKALHMENFPAALVHVDHALSDTGGFSASGRDLLKALASLHEPAATRWQSMFDHIGAAVERNEDDLWTVHIDDLQRLLWYVVVQRHGDELRQWMEARQYSVKYAPLYHAFVAAIEGNDHLLKINPETRQAAMRIYEGLVRRLRIYPAPPRPFAKK